MERFEPGCGAEGTSLCECEVSDLRGVAPAWGGVAVIRPISVNTQGEPAMSLEKEIET
jgi:hypothetical protein